MNYNSVNFDMNLAKHVSSNQSYGRVVAVDFDQNEIGTAEYISRSDSGGYKFMITPFASSGDLPPVPYSRHFDCNGLSTGVDDKRLQLKIEILSDEDLQINSDYDPHYHKLAIEPITYIMANKMTFPEGCIVKYISRYKDKGTPLDDLRKIKVYVDYIIDDLTKEQ